MKYFALCLGFVLSSGSFQFGIRTCIGYWAQWRVERTKQREQHVTVTLETAEEFGRSFPLASPLHASDSSPVRWEPKTSAFQFRVASSLPDRQLSYMHIILYFAVIHSCINTLFYYFVCISILYIYTYTCCYIQ